MKKQPVTHSVLKLLKKKAFSSDCTYKISGIAFDKKGDILGHVSNMHSSWDITNNGTQKGRSGTAKHAEKLLISRYGQNIKSIVICRVGHSGNIRPIDPCPACQKLADKLGIKITSISA